MAKHPTLYMETTNVDPLKTLGEITAKLVQAGAIRIINDYSVDGRITGIAFCLRINNNDVPFKIPVNVEPIYRIIHGRKTRSSYTHAAKQASREQAERVAWRQVLRWIESQLAFIQCGMAKCEEVFLPYMLGDNGRTFFEIIAERQFKALPYHPQTDEVHHG